MARDDERLARRRNSPIVGGLPDVPGILAAIRLTPGLGVHLRGLADELLVNDFPGRDARPRGAGDARDGRLGGQRLLLLHGLARRVRERALLERARRTELDAAGRQIKLGLDPRASTPRCARCSHIARTVRRDPREPDAPPTSTRRTAGGRDRRRRPARRAHRRRVLACTTGWSMASERGRLPTPEAYRARAAEIAAHGYSDQRVTSVPS